MGERGAGAACLLPGIAASSATGPATEGQSLRGARLERLVLGGVERRAARLVVGSAAERQHDGRLARRLARHGCR